MKCFEQLVKTHICSSLSVTLDPLQFAYRPNRATVEAITLAIHTALTHLDKRNTYVRILFIDYSSAFNTIIPSKLFPKLVDLGLETSISRWIFDFPTGRPQVVRISSHTSSSLILNTGVPHGCVLSPLLYSLFTYDCTAKHSSNVIIKFADDMTILGLITDSDETAYREEVRVSSFKFLGVHITEDLTWSLHTDSMVRKARQQLYFLRRLRKFGMNTSVLTNVYRCTIESLLMDCITVCSVQKQTNKNNSPSFHPPALLLQFLRVLLNVVRRAQQQQSDPGNGPPNHLHVPNYQEMEASVPSAQEFVWVPVLNSRKSYLASDKNQDGFVKVRKRDLERLTTEVMQLREFLPRVVNGDFIEMLHKARAAETINDLIAEEQEQLRQECLHFHSRLDAAQSECQKEREEKLVLREQLWDSRQQIRQQAEFCTGLGAATCTLLWSTSGKEEAVKDILADGKLQPFLKLAAQTLESFVKSLEGEAKAEPQDQNSHEHQFVLALAGVITNIAAVTCGRDYLSSCAHVLLDTLMQLLELIKPGTFPKLKVLMLMALYNISISVKGLKYISESPGLLPLIWTLLEDGDCEVCLHSLRLLQSLLLEEEVVTLLGPALLEPLHLARIDQLASSHQLALRQTAQETLEDLQALLQTSQDHLSTLNSKAS
ncbi:heat shock factor 2-binding protein [Polymixia lowei]